MNDALKNLRSLKAEELPDAAEKLRRTIIESVSRNGGHLASSCGCVELIVALHRIFNTPSDKIFFDVGHQAYAHKLLTGREEGFAKLRKTDGVSGFTEPWESPEFDPAVSGHAGSALSAALGHCAAFPDAEERIIAVIGDGAMGCGVTLEALNHASSLKGSRRLLVILNDNRMSISPNVGALSKVLNRVIAAKSYNKVRSFFKRLISPMPGLKRLFSRIDDAWKSIFLPPALFFETLGFRYFGAINGNDFKSLIPTLERLKNIDGPILLHVITDKGHGCDFAAAEPTRYHGISGCDPNTGEMKTAQRGFSQAFAEALETLAEEDDRITAVCPAMLEGVGLSGFAEKYPERCFDVGIAEEHALTFASGLAAAGKLPVCAFYDTFLQRSLDAVYHDIALAGLPVIIAVDRSGAVTDGPTHHGIYNCGFLRAIPGVTVIAPAGENEILPALRFAKEATCPVVVRYAKGSGIEFAENEPFVMGKAVIRRRGRSGDGVLWACGAELRTAMKTAELLEKDGLDITVCDARFLKPFDRETAEKFAGELQFTLEDHSICGGLFSALNEAVAGINHREIHGFGWNADRMIPHGDTGELKKAAGLTAEQIAEKIAGLVKKNQQ